MADDSQARVALRDGLLSTVGLTAVVVANPHFVPIIAGACGEISALHTSMSNKIRTQPSSPKTDKPRPNSAEPCLGRAPQDGTLQDDGCVDATIAALPELEQTSDPSIHPACNENSRLRLPPDLSPGATSKGAGTFVLGVDASGGQPANFHCLELAVADLRPHPLNAQIYGDESTTDESLTRSIKEGGVRTPLHVTADNVVIAGHRRDCKAPAQPVSARCQQLSSRWTRMNSRRPSIFLRQTGRVKKRTSRSSASSSSSSGSKRAVPKHGCKPAKRTLCQIRHRVSSKRVPGRPATSPPSKWDFPRERRAKAKRC